MHRFAIREGRLGGKVTLSPSVGEVGIYQRHGRRLQSDRGKSQLRSSGHRAASRTSRPLSDRYFKIIEDVNETSRLHQWGRPHAGKGGYGSIINSDIMFTV